MTKIFHEYILFFLITAAFLYAFSSVLMGLWGVWSISDEHSYGFFIIPISLYVIWQKKQVFRESSKKPSWLGGIGFVFSLLLYIGSKYAGIATIASVSMIFCLVCLVLFFWGWAIIIEMAFPLFFLILMIPIPDQIYSSLTMPLQLIVSKLSVSLSNFLGMAVLREGNVIYLPENTLEVVQACSGLRSLMSLLALSLVMGYFSLSKNRFRFALIVFALPIAIMVNVVRVFIMIVSSYYFKYDLTADSVHTIFGLIIFSLALAVIFGFQKVMLVWDTPIKSK